MIENMTHKQFIEKCNEAGEAKKKPSVRYDQTARSCGRVGDFSIKGLSFLASLLSDSATAAGAIKEQSQMPDHSKIWAMGFLAEFNPEGHLAFEDPQALRNFAQQVVEGRDQYEPVTATVTEAQIKRARIPSIDILKQVIQRLDGNGVKVSMETILEEIEEYYEAEEMTLPSGWEKITENNLKKWKLV
jgi:hypothetical protein